MNENSNKKENYYLETVSLANSINLTPAPQVDQNAIPEPKIQEF